MTKLWGGRFTKTAEEWVDAFGASISFDQRLVHQDIEGSLAHVTMLGKCGILPEDEVELIKNGLMSLSEKAKAGELEFSVQNEDIHLNLERLLIEEVGPVGGKLHTGRSRNDQVATDMHLYLRTETKDIMAAVKTVQQALLHQAGQHVETLIPGYTHLQRAQPVSFAHHLLAYFWMLERDYGRYKDSIKRLNVSPLGAGAWLGQPSRLIANSPLSCSALNPFTKTASML